LALSALGLPRHMRGEGDTRLGQRQLPLINHAGQIAGQRFRVDKPVKLVNSASSRIADLSSRNVPCFIA
jgi:hypothetical protein